MSTKAAAKDKKNPAQEMTPQQCQEELADLLEMQIEQAILLKKETDLHKAHKDAKESREAKDKQIMDLLGSLNQDLPLFDADPGKIPWAFPLTDEALPTKLIDMAADDAVFGLSVQTVKACTEKTKAKTLGELQKHLGADKKLSVDEQTKAKTAFGKLLGKRTALVLLRAVESFMRSRWKLAEPKKAKKGEEPAAAAPDAEWQLRRLSEFERYGLTPGVVAICSQADTTTVGSLLKLIDGIEQGAPHDAPKSYVKQRLRDRLNATDKIADTLLTARVKLVEEFADQV